MLTLWILDTETIFHKKILGSYVEFLCHICGRKVEKEMKLPLAHRAVTLEQGENVQYVWLSEVSTLAAECVNCKNNLEAKSENK